MSAMPCHKCGSLRKVDNIRVASGWRQSPCYVCGDSGYFEPDPDLVHKLTPNDFDTDWHDSCEICGDAHNHHGEPHGVATGDGLTRDDIIAYIDGRGMFIRTFEPLKDPIKADRYNV